METTSGVHFVGFRSHEIGSYYVRRLSMAAQHFDFVSLSVFFARVPKEEQKRSKVVFFRTEQDVDLHVQDRSKFPYPDYELSPDEVANEG